MRKASTPLLLALVPLLGACAYLGGSGGTDGTQTRFGSLTSCEPVNWVWLERDSRSLPPAEQEQVDRLLTEARGYYSDGNRSHCIIALQKAESLVLSRQS
jgi:hypothetical protein